MTEPTIPPTNAFQIKLPDFEGPLDLLLHLIKKHELDVLNLPIAFVTERYLEYLQMMQQLDLDLASEYLLMAATLAHIKSKMLLPQAPSLDNVEEQDDAYQEDPRAELIRRLLEYQKYKAVAQQLGERPLAGRDVFPRGVPAPVAQGPAPLASIDIYKLLDAFQSILKRVQGRVVLEVSAERITIHERMTQLADFLRSRKRCTFEELFELDRTRYEVVVTFLALLEMTKLSMTRVFQSDPQSPLQIEYRLLEADGGETEIARSEFDEVAAPVEFAAAEDAEDAEDLDEAEADDDDLAADDLEVNSSDDDTDSDAGSGGAAASDADDVADDAEDDEDEEP